MKEKKSSKKKKIAVYIDGSNFYFSVKNSFGLKVDIEKFCKKLVGNNELTKINYYIAPIEQFSDPMRYSEQQSFFEKIKKINKLNLIFGRLEKRKRGEDVYYVEKASDVNMALDLALDAQKGIYDEAYLVSNDGDFSGAVLSAREFRKKVIYIAVGNKKMISHHLKKASSGTFYVTRKFVEDCKLEKQG